VPKRQPAKLGPSFRGAAFIPQHKLVDALKDMGLLPRDWKPKPKYPAPSDDRAKPDRGGG
jgi:hypothetical protein